MVQRAATAALVALSVSGLVQQAGFAASERTTALVTIAEANARCLIQTKQMKAAQAQNITNRFLTNKGGERHRQERGEKRSRLRRSKAQLHRRTGGLRGARAPIALTQPLHPR